MRTIFIYLIKLLLPFILVILVILLLTQTSCTSHKSYIKSKQESQSVSVQGKDNPYKNAAIDIKTFKVDTLGWGYDIYLWKSLYVHQT